MIVATIIMLGSMGFIIGVVFGFFLEWKPKITIPALIGLCVLAVTHDLVYTTSTSFIWWKSVTSFLSAFFGCYVGSELCKWWKK